MFTQGYTYQTNTYPQEGLFFSTPSHEEEKSKNKYLTGVQRYGFQGQEMDDEVKGEGNSVNFKYRMHDPRVGRFFAVDPLEANYPWNSPYAFSENSVIAFVELEGLEKKYYLVNRVQIDGKTVFKKVYSHTIQGHTDIHGNFQKYDLEFNLTEGGGPDKRTWLFDDKQDFKNFKGSLWDLFVNPTVETKEDIVSDLINSNTGEKGKNRSVADKLISTLNRAEYYEFEKNHNIDVIVGSFCDEENAINLSESIMEKYAHYVDITITETEEGGYRVSIGTFEYKNKVQALKLRNMARELGVKDAWLITTENSNEETLETEETTEQ